MKRLLLMFLAALAVLAFAGCNTTSSVTTPGNNNGNTSTVPASLSPVLANDETADPAGAGVYGGSDGLGEIGSSDEAVITGAFAPGLAIPDSIRLVWWRKINSFNYTLTRSGDTDSVAVSVSRTLNGVFNARYVHRKNKPDTLLYSKPFGVTWNRSAVFKKLPFSLSSSGEDGTMWQLVLVSLAHAVQISPTGVTLPAIQSVTLTGHDSSGAPLSVTFNDPTQLYDPRTLPMIPVGDSVSVKVVTDGNDSNQLAFIHFDWDGAALSTCWRRPLAYNSTDGAFEGSFKVREGFGGRHPGHLRARSAVWVDVITKATLDDTTAPYAGDAWGVPYRIFRHRGAAFAFRD